MKGSKPQRCFDKLHLVFHAPVLLSEIKQRMMKGMSGNFRVKESLGRLAGKESR